MRTAWTSAWGSERAARLGLRLLLLTCLLSLARHAWLAQYAHPMADDFSYARKDLSAGLHAAAAWEYAHWNGRYTSNLLVLAGPLRNGLDRLTTYRLVPVLLILGTWLSASLLLRAFPFAGAWRPALTGGLLWTALFSHAMPDIGEGWYWYTGAVTYQLAVIIALLHATLLIRLHRAREALTLAAAAVLLFVAIGFNEVIMALLLLLHLGLVAWHRRVHGRVPGWAWALLAVAIAGALLVLLAPGNAGRGAHFPMRHRPLPSLGMSLVQTARFCLVWLSSPAVLATGLLFLLGHDALRQRFPALRRWEGPPWPWAVLAVPAVVFACVFPAYWSTGVLGQYRTLNMACFLFLPLLAMALHAWRMQADAPRKLVPQLAKAPVAAALLGFVLIGLVFLRNGRRANGDLFGGRAALTDRELRARHVLLADPNAGDTVLVPGLTDPARSLCVFDVQQDPGWIQNADYALWFGRRAVLLAPSDPAKATKR